MASRAERVALLCDISRELQRCGPIFLATLLVEEAYQRECLEGMAFGKAGQDAAVLRLNAACAGWCRQCGRKQHLPCRRLSSARGGAGR